MPETTIATTKAQLAAAFRALRKSGFIIRRSYRCCMGCALAALTAEMKDMSAAERKQVPGIAYYHQQDAEAFRVRTRPLYVRFTSANPKADMEETRRVGCAVAAALTAAGLTVTWNGSGHQALSVAMF